MNATKSMDVERVIEEMSEAIRDFQARMGYDSRQMAIKILLGSGIIEQINHQALFVAELKRDLKRTRAEIKRKDKILSKVVQLLRCHGTDREKIELLIEFLWPALAPAA